MKSSSTFVFFTSLVWAAMAVAEAPSNPPRTLHVYVAGSGAKALAAMAASYTASTGQAIDIVKGPAGLLRQRIEQGADADIYVSADMANPQALANHGKASRPVVFAHNTLCVVARKDVGLTQGNLLDKLLDPAIAIGTSTPGNDPGGDYAWAVFARAELVRSGARSILVAKAQPLVGGKAAPHIPAGASPVTYFLTSKKVDVFFSYCSAQNGTDPALVSVAIPPDLTVPVDYGMSVMARGSHDAASQTAAEHFAHYLLEPAAQRMLAGNGLVAATDKSQP